MASQVKVNTAIDLFVHPTDPVDEYSDYTTLTADDFTVRVWDGDALDEDVADAVTFSQVGTTGEYHATVTFPTIGFWSVEIRVASPLNQIYREEYEVKTYDSDELALRGRAL